MLNAEYVHGAFLGSRVLAQAYVRDYETTFRPFDDRRYRTVTDTAADGTTSTRRQYTNGYVMQTYVESRKHGGRLQAETPLLERFGASVLWGADYTDETTAQPVHLYDSVAFVQSSGRVFAQTGGAKFVPPLDLETLGLFAQLSVRPLGRVMLSGGARHERGSVQVDDFTALNGVSITGGTLRSRPVLFNAGAVVRVTEAVTCSPTELSSCLQAITTSSPPSATCCSKLKEQRPCLCGYLKDPNLSQYFNSPNARKVATTCGVSTPNC